MKRILLSCTVALLVALCCAVPVYAIDDPDSAPEINAVFVYEDLLEDGDIGVLIDYNIVYTVVPDETVTEAYLVIFIDTDGTTQLRAIAPYTFVNSGYGRGLAWIYFTADEVTTYGLTSTDVALYRVWLVGNPTLSWVGDPPKTVASIDEWQTTGDASVLLALRVLYYADILEIAWSAYSVDMIETTSLGSRLASGGEAYFDNVIPYLRTIAPSAYASGEYLPIIEDLDYATEFGAVMTNGTGIVTGSPITFAEGTTTVTVTTAGTFTIELEKGTSGTIEDNGGTVTGSPVDLVYGVNTVTVPGGGTGTLDVTLEFNNTQTALSDTVIGTGFDLTTIAATVGMSRIMFSSIIWFALSTVICAFAFSVKGKNGVYTPQSRGKAVMIIFDLCIIGGIILGLLHIIVGILMFIAFGFLTGYILFFRGANI